MLPEVTSASTDAAPLSDSKLGAFVGAMLGKLDVIFVPTPVDRTLPTDPLKGKHPAPTSVTPDDVVCTISEPPKADTTNFETGAFVTHRVVFMAPGACVFQHCCPGEQDTLKMGSKPLEVKSPMVVTIV